MLKNETVEGLKKLGLDVDKLVAAIKAETETEYKLPDVVALSPTDLEARDNNMKAEGKKEGESGARETLVKELGKKLNTEFKSTRLGDLANEIQEFTNKSNDEKVKLLQGQVTALTADKEKLAADVEAEKSKAAQAAFDAELIGYFPAGRAGDLSDTDRLNIIKANLQFETVDGKVVVKRNGQLVQDEATRAPKQVKDVLGDFFKEKPSLVGVAPAGGAGGQGGRGGGNSGAGGGGASRKYSEVKNQWLKDNPEGNPVSPEFQNYVQKIAAETTDFSWNE